MSRSLTVFVTFSFLVLPFPQLLEVLLPLLEQLVQEDDVRPVLREKFGMAKWFRQRGFATDSCKS